MIPESSLWIQSFAEENKLLLAAVYSLKSVSMCILLWFKKSHCGRRVLLLARNIKPPFRIPAVNFFFVRKTFLMFLVLLLLIIVCPNWKYMESCRVNQWRSVIQGHCKSSWSVKNLQLLSLLNWTNRSQNGRKHSCKWKCSHWCLGHGQIQMGSFMVRSFTDRLIVPDSRRTFLRIFLSSLSLFTPDVSSHRFNIIHKAFKCKAVFSSVIKKTPLYLPLSN